MRGQFDRLVEELTPQCPPPSPAVQKTEYEINDLKLRVYSTKALSPSISRPVAIFAHPGGFVMGNLDSEDPVCCAIVENTGTVVISVDYRLAPEYKCPAQLDDMLSVLQWAPYCPYHSKGHTLNLCRFARMSPASMATKTRCSPLAPRLVLG